MARISGVCGGFRFSDAMYYHPRACALHVLLSNMRNARHYVDSMFPEHHSVNPARSLENIDSRSSDFRISRVSISLDGLPAFGHVLLLPRLMLGLAGRNSIS